MSTGDHSKRHAWRVMAVMAVAAMVGVLLPSSSVAATADEQAPDAAATAAADEAAVAAEAAVRADDDPPAPPIVPEDYVTDVDALEEQVAEGPGLFIVTVRTDLAAGHGADGMADIKGQIVDDLAAGAAVAGPAAAEPEDLENLPVLLVPGSQDAIDVLVDHPLVAAVEPNTADETHMDVVSDIINSDDLNAAGVRGNGWEGGPAGHAVVVLDTGVDNQHNAFNGRIVSQACYAEGATTGDASGDCPNGLIAQVGGASGDNCPLAWGSACEHGTHVAGIAAGNDVGAGDDGVGDLLPIIGMQIFSNFGGGSVLTWNSDQLKGMNRAIALHDAGTPIGSVNMSLGGGRYFSAAACDSANASRKAAIDALWARGIATVISAGNSGYTDSMGAPGCISTAITVGATTDTDGFAWYTNSNSYMDFWAPGGAASGAGTGVLSSVPTSPNAYAEKSGTSMAAPAVAGAFALLKECGEGPGEWSATTINNRLHNFGLSLTRGVTTTERIDVLAATATANLNDKLSRAEEVVLAGAGSSVTESDYTNCTTARDGAEPGEATIWYEVTPSVTGDMTVALDGTFNNEVRVYSGPNDATNFGQLGSRLAYDNNSGPGLNALVTLPVTAGTRYYVQVDGAGAQNGSVDTTFSLSGAAPARIGNKVWRDLNGNGRQNAGEPGVPGVRVRLLDRFGNTIANRRTNAAGIWAYDVDPTKLWKVRVFAPTGFSFTTRDVGSNDAIDSDARPQGIIIVPASKLSSGVYNPTFDAGLVP